MTGTRRKRGAPKVQRRVEEAGGHGAVTGDPRRELPGLCLEVKLMVSLETQTISHY